MSSQANGRNAPAGPVFTALAAASLCHFLNDLMQSLFLASYPLFKGGLSLSFAQIGLLTMTFQVTGSLLQPLVGFYTDRRPLPYSLPFGMASSLAGVLTVAYAGHYSALLAGAVLLGIGSSIFHPETSRLARLASGGSHGLAQSIFQIGGNSGTALGPLAVAFFVLPRGRESLAWFSLAALLGVVVMSGLGRWYQKHLRSRPAARTTGAPARSRREIAGVMALLLALIMSKYFYIASITSYYIFYLMHHFGLAEHKAQLALFVFLAGMAVGTMIGGPVGDRIGRKAVIWGSILGTLPFSLALPHVGLPATVVLSGVIGVILSSAFPSIVVYGQELLPGRVGTVSGLFFGLAFGIGGLGAALLGVVADWKGIDFVYQICSVLPAIGLLAAFLPDLDRPAAKRAPA
ncbi:MFS transporter [Solirhodobacter olei]|uniref:MFS transporter n=1 Tax=Solirhodobacter olei TaxID=2493082 RepID=UPI000FDC1252|nr:MFS transporter [Solirhodobacter olei]